MKLTCSSIVKSDPSRTMILQTIRFLFGFTCWDVWAVFFVEELNPFSDLLFRRLKNLSISSTFESLMDNRYNTICQRQTQGLHACNFQVLSSWTLSKLGGVTREPQSSRNTPLMKYKIWLGLMTESYSDGVGVLLKHNSKLTGGNRRNSLSLILMIKEKEPTLHYLK